MSGHLAGGRYRLRERLGHGGMSVVWRATDEVLGRDVAVKVLAPQLADDPAVLRRLRDEARAAAALRHPHIVEVYDYGEDTLPYVVMELVEGRTLADLLRDGALPWRLAVAIGAQVAAALAAAHAHGVVHCDVKPANVMVTDAGVKLVDFGIAAAVGAVEDPGDQVLGTPAYLAPERIAGGPIVAATDVYAVGLLLHLALAGHPPWDASTVTQMLRAHVYAEPAALPPVAGLPGSVTRLVRRCLAKQPADRPGAGDVADRLGRIAGLPPAKILDVSAVGRSGAGVNGGPSATARLRASRQATFPIAATPMGALKRAVAPFSALRRGAVPLSATWRAAAPLSTRWWAAAPFNAAWRAVAPFRDAWRSAAPLAAGRAAGATIADAAAAITRDVDRKAAPRRPADAIAAVRRAAVALPPAQRRVAAGALAGVALLAGGLGVRAATGDTPGSQAVAAAGTPASPPPAAAGTPSAARKPVAVTKPETCTVRYALRGTSAGQASARLTIHNTGEVAVPAWKLSFALPSGQRLIKGSSATWRQNGRAVEAAGGKLPAGGTAATSFSATYSKVAALPVTFRLNGTPCQAEMSVQPLAVTKAAPKPVTRHAAPAAQPKHKVKHDDKPKHGNDEGDGDDDEGDDEGDDDE